MTPGAQGLRRDHEALPSVTPLGDSAVLLTLTHILDLDANALARGVALDIRARRMPWVTEVIPALVTVAVCFEARTAREAAERRATLERLLLEAVDRAGDAAVAPPLRTVEIPLCYEPPFAPDLLEVAARPGSRRPRLSPCTWRPRIGC